MLNAMPLPIGPTEPPNGLAKPDMPNKPPEGDATGEDTTSFVATLEAVHKNGRKPVNDENPEGDDTSNTSFTVENEDVAQKSEDRNISADGILNPTVAEQALPKNGLDLASGDKQFASDSAKEATPPTPQTEMMDDAAGLMKESGAAPPANKVTEVVAPRQAVVVYAEALAGGNGKETVPDTLSQGGADTPKAVAGGVKADQTESGPQTSTFAENRGAQALQVMEAAPDNKSARKGPQTAFDGLSEKAAKVDETMARPNLEEGETQFSDKKNPAFHLPQKGVENRQTELETPAPGRSRAEVPGFQAVRSQVADDSQVSPKTFSDKVPEAPLAVTNDDAGPMAGRQVAFDSPLSFSELPAGGKIAMASGPTSAAPTTVTADTFPQENFHQLVERALFTVRGQQSEARIALKPDHLGHVQMKIVTENNFVNVKIVTETPVARDLIEANANQLKAELQQQGLNVESIEVSVSDERHDAYRQARQRGSFLRHMASHGNAQPEEEGDRPGNGPAQQKSNRKGNTGIDYFA